MLGDFNAAEPKADVEVAGTAVKGVLETFQEKVDGNGVRFYLKTAMSVCCDDEVDCHCEVCNNLFD